MVICPDCGTEVPDAKFCKNCGASLPQTNEDVNVEERVPVVIENNFIARRFIVDYCNLDLGISGRNSIYQCT